jgi:hypothetical protein
MQRTPLMYAASHGHARLVQLLLEAGAGVGQRALGGRQPLHFASYRGHGDVVALLLAHKADVNATDSATCTPVGHAATYGHVGVVSQLLEAKADVALRDRNGSTPIAHACRKGHFAVVSSQSSCGGGCVWTNAARPAGRPHCRTRQRHRSSRRPIPARRTYPSSPPCAHCPNCGEKEPQSKRNLFARPRYTCTGAYGMATIRHTERHTAKVTHVPRINIVVSIVHIVLGNVVFGGAVVRGVAGSAV